ncbi:MAG TPA: alpha-L-arabinofuranosidase C-terminal domain-containing protein [Verrucomicrobiae bacterium]|nr:alpha-L-arabinofuranosidase C-terminal domain-containing protein [Verrucomicrobiae bacterium]
MNHSNRSCPTAFILVIASLGAFANGLFAQASLTVDVDKPGHAISPTLWGIFFEDINLSADGGIYPELVRNRSFEDSDQPDSWTLSDSNSGKSKIAIDSSRPLNPFNRHSLCVTVDGSVALENEGYWGMNVVQDDTYVFKVAARGAEDFSGPLTVRVLSASGSELAKGEVTSLSHAWRYHTLKLTPAASDPKARLQISAAGKGSFYLDMVSLMPEKTFKNHGLRPDLAESLDHLHPSFMRFPGGCWVEGDDFAHMNHWKRTVGNIDVREPLWNIWGYHATHGLGFYEYLQMAEDLGATPLFCINIGMSHHEIVPMDRMGEWVQDALDAIEYANGPTNSVWGSRRAAAGHPAPFNLSYMEIGNENANGPAYFERWPLFYKAIKAKYPDMRLVADGWGAYGDCPPDVVDDHYYDTPEWFMRHAGQYDHAHRNGPKIFVGEYAVTQNTGKGNLRGAIGEAAFMTGLERNSDQVIMASYAPLLVNLNHRAWNPDLINFDSSKWYGLPSYYVQQMFSANRGDVVLPVQVDAQETAVPQKAAGMIGVGTWNTEAEFKDIKVTAPDGKVLFASDFSHDAGGWKELGDGHWDVKDGALQQTAEQQFVRAIAGDKSWTDYTLTLKARKLGGKEGFLILFRVANDEDRTWWNIGGWDNTQDGVEYGGTIDRQPARIETGRWYDIRLEVSGKKVKCSLDGQVVHDVDYINDSVVKALYASASHDDNSGEVILKVVNASAEPINTAIHLKGANDLARSGQAIVLTSNNPTDENSLETPDKVSPQTQILSLPGQDFQRIFPGNSFTVLRIGTQKASP